MPFSILMSRPKIIYSLLLFFLGLSKCWSSTQLCINTSLEKITNRDHQKTMQEILTSQFSPDNLLISKTFPESWPDDLLVSLYPQLISLEKCIASFPHDKEIPEKNKTVIHRHYLKAKNQIILRTINYQREKLDPKKLKDLLLSEDGAFSFDKNLFNPSMEYTKENESRPAGKTQVLHAALEYRETSLGGLGAVTSALIPEQNNAKVQASIITPFFDFLSEKYPKAEYIGPVEHEFKGGMVNSNIFKVTNGVTKDGKGVTQFLIKPDPKFENLFDIGSSISIYKNFENSGNTDRVLYYAAALSKFAATYGTHQNDAFDVLHMHAWQAALPSKIIKDKYFPEFLNGGRKPLALIQQVHLVSDEQGQHEQKILNDVGLPLENPNDPKSQINIQEMSLRNSDAIVYVSKNAAKEAQVKETGFGLDPIIRQLEKEGKLFGVTNGIDTSPYLNFRQNFENLKEVNQNPKKKNKSEDPLADKMMAKEILYQNGVISDPTKPLFMYVGRYSGEKGVDMLKTAVEEVKKRNGQMVIMGLKTFDKKAMEHLKELEILAKDKSNSLKVYTDINDQLGLLDLGGKKFKKGDLIRFASDMTVVPSHKESCGLIPMEAFCLGSLTLSSFEQGLKDTCKGMGDIVDGLKITHSEFNSFNYQNNDNRVDNLIMAIDRAMEFLKTSTHEEKNEIIKRLYKSCPEYDWKAHGGAMDKYSQIYEKAILGAKNKMEETKLHQRGTDCGKKSSTSGLDSPILSLLEGLEKLKIKLKEQGIGQEPFGSISGKEILNGPLIDKYEKKVSPTKFIGTTALVNLFDEAEVGGLNGVAVKKYFKGETREEQERLDQYFDNEVKSLQNFEDINGKLKLLAFDYNKKIIISSKINDKSSMDVITQEITLNARQEKALEQASLFTKALANFHLKGQEKLKSQEVIKSDKSYRDLHKDPNPLLQRASLEFESYAKEIGKIPNQPLRIEIEKQFTKFLENKPNNYQVIWGMKDPSFRDYFPESGSLLDFNASSIGFPEQDMAAALVNVWLNASDQICPNGDYKPIKNLLVKMVEDYQKQMKNGKKSFDLDFNRLKFFMAYSLLKSSNYAVGDWKEKLYKKIKVLLVPIDRPDPSLLMNQLLN